MLAFRAWDHCRGSSRTVACSMSTLLSEGSTLGVVIIVVRSFNVVDEAIRIADALKLRQIS